jgi:hypothetical protein
MTAAHDIDWPTVLADRLTTTHPDVLRDLLATFIHTLMGAGVDALCGAGYGERSTERTNQRNGYRHRQFGTRTGSLDLAIPKLRQGPYFPDWLLERRKRAERALTTVVATCYLLGCPPSGWTSWWKPWASPACRSPKSASWPRNSTPRSRRSAPAPWTPAPTRSSPPTRWC